MPYTTPLQDNPFFDGPVEQGTGSEIISFVVAFPFSDHGAGHDIPLVSSVNSIAASDHGTGHEHVVGTGIAYSATDNGTGHDSQTWTSGYSLIEHGTGQDIPVVSSVNTLSFIEHAAGHDTPLIAIAIPEIDHGAGHDSQTWTADYFFTEHGKGSEIITIPTVTLQLIQNATGHEVLLPTISMPVIVEHGSGHDQFFYSIPAKTIMLSSEQGSYGGLGSEKGSYGLTGDSKGSYGGTSNIGS